MKPYGWNKICIVAEKEIIYVKSGFVSLKSIINLCVEDVKGKRKKYNYVFTTVELLSRSSLR